MSVESIGLHLEKCKQLLVDAKKGIVPKRHEDGIPFYIFFLEKEITYHTNKLEKMVLNKTSK
jgi:hypothetical protein